VKERIVAPAATPQGAPVPSARSNAWRSCVGDQPVQALHLPAGSDDEDGWDALDPEALCHLEVPVDIHQIYGQAATVCLDHVAW